MDQLHQWRASVWILLNNILLAKSFIPSLLLGIGVCFIHITSTHSIRIITHKLYSLPRRVSTSCRTAMQRVVLEILTNFSVFCAYWVCIQFYSSISCSLILHFKSRGVVWFWLIGIDLNWIFYIIILGWLLVHTETGHFEVVLRIYIAFRNIVHLSICGIARARTCASHMKTIIEWIDCRFHLFRLVSRPHEIVN